MRCAQCGENNPDSATECQICHSPMKSYRRVILTSATPSAQVNSTNITVPASSSAPAACPPPAPPSSKSKTVALQPNKVANVLQNIPTTPLPQRNQIQGRVIYLGQLEQHPKDFDWYLFLAFFPFLLLGLPVLAGLFAIYTALRLSGLSRRPFTFSQNLFQSVLLASLFRRGNASTEPMRTLRIRDKLLQQEVSVTIRGHLSSGDIILDDDVTIWGSWRNGNFIFARGVNQRTGSKIRLRVNRAKIFFWVAICILVGVALLAFGLVTGTFK